MGIGAEGEGDIVIEVLGYIFLAVLYAFLAWAAWTIWKGRRRQRVKVIPGPTSPLNEIRRWQAASARTYARQGIRQVDR